MRCSSTLYWLPSNITGARTLLIWILKIWCPEWACKEESHCWKKGKSALAVLRVLVISAAFHLSFPFQCLTLKLSLCIGHLFIKHILIVYNKQGTILDSEDSKMAGIGPLSIADLPSEMCEMKTAIAHYSSAHACLDSVSCSVGFDSTSWR